MLILASSSATRQTMLRHAGVAFTARAADLPEEELMRDWRAQNLGAAAVAENLAVAKAMAISAQNPDALVIGADQMLICGDVWLSKAKGLDEAKNHLRLLAGKTHQLLTATVLVRSGNVLWRIVDTADITLRDLTAAEIDAYVARVPDNILHSVGCYQFEGLGAQLIAAYRGDYFTILGLALLPLLAALREHGGQ
jgi:septum formation protein